MATKPSGRPRVRSRRERGALELRRPPVLIGLPDGIVTFDEGEAARADVEAAEAADGSGVGQGSQDYPHRHGLTPGGPGPQDRAEAGQRLTTPACP